MTPIRNARISELQNCRRSTPPGGAFADLTWTQQRAAEAWYWKFCQRWAGDLPQWRRAILTGVAKRLALHPPGPTWSRRMFAVKGGKAAQRRHRLAGVDAMALARAAKVSNKPKTAQRNPVRHLDL
jgi:hypothetical protein